MGEGMSRKPALTAPAAFRSFLFLSEQGGPGLPDCFTALFHPTVLPWPSCSYGNIGSYCTVPSNWDVLLSLFPSYEMSLAALASSVSIYSTRFFSSHDMPGTLWDSGHTVTSCGLPSWQCPGLHYQFGVMEPSPFFLSQMDTFSI